jgi:hypothetical protein
MTTGRGGGPLFGRTRSTLVNQWEWIGTIEARGATPPRELDRYDRYDRYGRFEFDSRGGRLRVIANVLRTVSELEGRERLGGRGVRGGGAGDHRRLAVAAEGVLRQPLRRRYVAVT